MWHDIILAVGLFLILEGLFPSLAPKRYKEFLKRMCAQSAASVRTMGVLLLVVGAVVVFIVKRIYGV